MFDASNVTLSLGPAVHGAVANHTVDVAVRFGLEGVARPVAPRQGVDGSLGVRLDLLLQQLHPLELGHPLVVWPPRHVRLESFLTGDGEVADLTPGWLGLGGTIISQQNAGEERDSTVTTLVREHPTNTFLGRNDGW